MKAVTTCSQEHLNFVDELEKVKNIPKLVKN